eukprot:Skav204242  [mRNA]  locus=scaffold4267:36497:40254:+ [translate_table: standard]
MLEPPKSVDKSRGGALPGDARAFEEARRQIVSATNRSAKVYLRVYPHNAVTQRRLEGVIADSRIGASKGKFEYWVAALKPGVVIFELDVESEESIAWLKLCYSIGPVHSCMGPVESPSSS